MLISKPNTQEARMQIKAGQRYELGFVLKDATVSNDKPAEGPERLKPTDRPPFRDGDPQSELMEGVDRLDGLDAKPDPFAPFVYEQIIPDAQMIDLLTQIGHRGDLPYNGPDVSISLSENGHGGVGADFTFSEIGSYNFVYLVNYKRNMAVIRLGDTFHVEDLGLEGNPYGDPTHGRVEVQYIRDYHGLHIKVAEGDFQLPPVQVALTDSVLSVDDATAHLGFDLSWPAKEKGEIRVSTAYGEYTINLVRGQSHYELDAPLSEGTPYGNSIDIFKAQVTGGGFVLLVEPCEVPCEHPTTGTEILVTTTDNGTVDPPHP